MYLLYHREAKIYSPFFLFGARKGKCLSAMDNARQPDRPGRLPAPKEKGSAAEGRAKMICVTGYVFPFILGLISGGMGQQ